MKKIATGLSLFFLLASCNSKTFKNNKITAKTTTIDSSITTTPAIDSTIAPYKKKLLSEINKALTTSSKKLVRTDGELQSSLGNLMADMCYDIANPIFREKTGKNIDFAMFNYGGIRAGLPEGNITNRHAFELMPFENSLVVAELSGKKIEELVSYFIAGAKAHPLSKNIQLELQGSAYTLHIQGKPFDPNKTYTVLTSDYLQGGGDRMDFFKDPVQLTLLDYKVRDAIIKYFKSVTTLTPQLDQRVVVKN
jgi:2',3'-cyclic-nucleotide 2'-phosphodiesterase (5'-nucleotidase family)